ncbi:MAG: HD domain-containing protein [Peptostreptococcaceae bacterium]|nr:HD domain-containing protein [Peptostreptococcaceae bacterium]
MDFLKDLEFVVELEKMKKIYRRTWIIGEDRRENDAEHSWHISVMAMLLSQYADDAIREKIDIDKIVKMLLVHDIVEIYAGDTFAYDTNGSVDKKERETQAMEKICSKLTKQNGDLVSSLWQEFEEMKTEDALMANALDRLQPVMSNIYSEKGGSWREFGITRSQIMKRIEPISKVSQKIYTYLLEQIEENIRKGDLTEDQ